MQLLLFMGMAFGVFLVFMMIGLFVLSQMTGISVNDLQNLNKLAVTDPNLVTYMRGMLLIQFLGLFLVPSLLFGYFSDPHPASYIGLKKPYSAWFWALAIIAMAVAYPLVEFTGWLNQQMVWGKDAQQWMRSLEEEASRQIQLMIKKRTPAELFANLVFIALFAGVGEELFFRGVLQRLFIKATRSPWLGIIIASVIFSGFHMQFLGFLPRLFLGILLGAMYWYSGSIWTSILAHFLYDAIIIVILYMNPALAQNPEATVIKPGMLAISAAFSAVLTVMVIVQMRKRSRARYEEIYRDDVPPADQFSF
jgi:uncharacterized protein